MGIRFLDGPAAGVVLDLRRTPVLLRVVRDKLSGTFDALDQLDDTAQPGEEIHVYRYVPESRSTLHIDGRRNGRRFGEWHINADYRALPEQPADDQIRTNKAWRAWAIALEQAEKEKSLT